MAPDLEARLRQLVMETRRGKAESYEALLRELVPFLRQIAMGQLARFHKTAYADDVTQDTLLAVHLKLHTYDATLPFLAWLRAVTRHKLIDLLRRLRLETVTLDDGNCEMLPDPVNVEAPAIHRDLTKLLGQLKPPAGDLIYALRVEGASVQDLSRQFHLSESNIKVLIHRGLQKLSLLIGAETLL